MKRTIILMSFLGLAAVVYSIVAYKKPDESALPGLACLTVAFVVFAVNCITISSLGEIPRAVDVLMPGTEFEILGVYSEANEFILVVAETLSIEDDSNDRIITTVRIDKEGHVPEAGKMFHVEYGHLVLDGSRAEIKKIMGAS